MPEDIDYDEIMKYDTLGDYLIDLMDQYNKEDYVLYLSGLDYDALKRVEARNECLRQWEIVRKYNERIKGFKV